MKTLSISQMWMLGLIALLAVVLYAYSVKDGIKVTGGKGCNTCPNKANNEYESQVH